MPYREHVPHPALRPFVDRFWTQLPGPGGSLPPAATAPRRILPDGCIDLLLNLRRGRAMAVGTMTRALVVPPGDSSMIVAVRFRPGGAWPLLRIPAHLLTDAQIDCADLGLGDLIPACLADGAADPGDAAARVLAALQQTLLRQAAAAGPPDPLIDHAVRWLLTPAAPPIELLARKVGWTRQHLRRVFATHVGVGPKHFDRVARLQRTIAAIQTQPRAALASVAAASGYFDQAHMAGDFRALVGVTPQVVRASAGSIFPIHSLLNGS